MRALQFKALGDETRLKILLDVAAGENQEECVCNLTPSSGLSQPTISHHLKILVEAGLLDRAQRCKWAYYSLTETAKKLINLN
jgi:ArsR family transcriptional regulator